MCTAVILSLVVISIDDAVFAGAILARPFLIVDPPLLWTRTSFPRAVSGISMRVPSDGSQKRFAAPQFPALRRVYGRCVSSLFYVRDADGARKRFSTTYPFPPPMHGTTRRSRAPSHRRFSWRRTVSSPIRQQQDTTLAHLPRISTPAELLYRVDLDREHQLRLLVSYPLGNLRPSMVDNRYSAFFGRLPLDAPVLLPSLAPLPAPETCARASLWCSPTYLFTAVALILRLASWPQPS
ncbi:hypothetical protein C8R43DRAFT_1118301 [Mycena crocata]|nr:hypothetical protein C8R43DRAFT_1118301 [Mycena crocata]